MTFDLLWNNIANYCLQIGLLIGVAGFIPTALRLAEPRARLAFWHILLAACLVLPLFAPWRQEVVGAGIPVINAPARPLPAQAPVRTRVIPWNQVGLGLLGAGVALRFAGLLLGLWRLRGYRRRSTPLEPPASWGVEADLRLSPDIASPVTFGAFHPVVLLPVHFPELDAATQEAILCHEVLHVRRRDWLVTMAEECLRCVFWFHPAIWWLLGEIGLAREQAVDREAIRMTRARDQYVDALLAIAGASPTLDLAPAPLFLRKRHLKHRIVSIMKEVNMSKARSVSALAASLGFLAAACWLVTLTFPLSAAPQTVADGPGVAVDFGNAALMHRTSIMYPPAARLAKVEGTVLVEATLDGSGNVVDARVLSGPTELRRSVLQSVLQWHFANDNGANTRQIRITFTTPPEGPAVVKTPTGDVVRVMPPTPASSTMVMRGSVPPSVQNMMVGKTLSQIEIAGLTDEAKSRLMARLPVHVGDVLGADSYGNTVAAVRDYDEHMTVGLRTAKDGTVAFQIMAPGANFPMPQHEAAPPPNGMRRITIGGNVQSSKLVQQARPMYPPLAKQARISGVVKFSVIIAADGTMKDIAVISGHPLLIPAALEAVRQWVYAPTLLNGEPVEVATQIDVNFTLSDDPPQQQ